jgi:uncharacterized RmlC-like cupin family protein
MPSVEVVRKSNLNQGYVTEGITRAKAFESENSVFSMTMVAPGALSGWHHHGKRELYAFVRTGRLRLEYGEGGKESVEAHDGDFIHVAPGVIHRDVNPGGEELSVVNVLVGEGPPVVNVDGPSIALGKEP